MPPRIVNTRLGSLDTAVVGSAEHPSLAVVLCHGYGAPGDDLVPLAVELLEARPKLAERVRFVFPQAPLSLAAMGMHGARAWWHLEMDRIMRMQQGDLSGMEKMRREVPEGLAPARKALLEVVNEVSRTSSLPLGKIVLGGFSQGSMITTDLSLRLDEPPAALAIFSGTLICEDEWRKRAKNRSGLRVFQSHGTADPILPYPFAEDLRDLLTHAGLSVEWVPFDGGHTISFDALGRFALLLEGLA